MPAKTIGITSTVPVEPIFASGAAPCDLNNVFITGPDPMGTVRESERRGIPHSSCGWVKGIFPVPSARGLRTVVVVSCGDCDDVVALADYWQEQGAEVLHFAYPPARTRDAVGRSIGEFCDVLGTTTKDAESSWRDLAAARAAGARVDRLSWTRGGAPHRRVHAGLVEGSDLGGDPAGYARRMSALAEEMEGTEGPATEGTLRLGYVGVPPITSDMFDVIEGFGGRVILDETAVQFGMAFPADDMVDQYVRYTYPYGARARAEWVAREASIRRLDGIILYTERACFRNLSNRLLKEKIGLPMVEVQGEHPGPTDERTKLRLETFIQTMMMRRDGS